MYGRVPDSPCGLAGVVDGDDGRVVQRRGVLRLAAEPGLERGVAGEVGAQHLDRHVPAEPQVTAAVHLGHAAEAEGVADLVAIAEQVGAWSSLRFLQVSWVMLVIMAVRLRRPRGRRGAPRSAGPSAGRAHRVASRRGPIGRQRSIGSPSGSRPIRARSRYRSPGLPQRSARAGRSPPTTEDEQPSASAASVSSTTRPAARRARCGRPAAAQRHGRAGGVAPAGAAGSAGPVAVPGPLRAGRTVVRRTAARHCGGWRAGARWRDRLTGRAAPGRRRGRRGCRGR